MRVLFVCNALGIGGTERNVMLHARELSRLGHEVRIHPLVLGGALDDVCNRWMVPSYRGGRNAGEIERRLEQHVREWQPDIVHALGSPAEFVAAAVCVRVPGPRYVLALQDRKPSRSRSAVWTMRWAARLADLVIPDGEGTRDQAIEEFRSPPDRTWTLIDGVDTEGLAPTRPRRETRAELGATGDELLVGVVARLDLPKKGQDVLLDAIAQIRIPQTRYVLVGDGPAGDVLRRQSIALGVQDRVCFAGTRSDLGDVINALDVAVVSSRWESVPKVILEEMALARPIVTTSAGDIPEVARDGENALVVPAGDPRAMAEAIERMLIDSSLRERLGQAALASIEAAGLTLRASVRRLAEQHARLLASSRHIERRSPVARWMDPLGTALARKQLRTAYPYMLESVAATSSAVSA